MKRTQIIDRIIDSELIEPGSIIIVGVSGGPDSLCLLHALWSISDAYDYLLVPVHVNHKLRKEADAEAEHIAMICEKMDLECRLYDADCGAVAGELGISTEEAGRNIRYQIFDDVADDLTEEGADAEKIVIALAHNADDQSETVLFRLLRGTGPHGLSGIPAFRLSASGHPVVRPLLSVERKDIEEYIRENKLKPNIDRSNDDNTYTRNKIRNELIPYLEKNYNPRIRDNLRRYANIANMDDTLLRDIAFTDYSENIEIDADNLKAVLRLDEIAENPPPINSRIVSLVFELLDLESLVTFENVMAVLDLIYSERPSAGVDLPMGIRAYREYDRLIFSGGEEKLLPDESIGIYPHVLISKDFHPDEDSAYAAFDFDEFSRDHPGRVGDIELRTRKEGDYLPIKGGSKKIQDYLVDSKVAKNARESILMVCIGSEVLWILPNEHLPTEAEKEKGKFSQKYHLSEATERVLYIEITDSI